MSVDPKINEWNLLKHQFDALAHEKGVGPDSAEEILIWNFVAASAN